MISEQHVPALAVRGDLAAGARGSRVDLEVLDALLHAGAEMDLPRGLCRRVNGDSVGRRCMVASNRSLPSGTSSV
jgi:hypothetical protein